MLSGNGNLLLFRTQAVNAGGSGGSSPRSLSATAFAVTDADSGDGKSTTGGVPSPTTDNPPPADVPPPPPSGSTEDPATSGDGNTTGTTVEPDPGTGGGEPDIELDETPPDADGTPFIAALSPSAGPTTGGNVVDIQGANFVNGQRRAVERRLIPYTFVNSGSLLRVIRADRGSAGPVPVRVMSAGEASNEVQVHLHHRPHRAVDHVVRPEHRRRSPAACR